MAKEKAGKNHTMCGMKTEEGQPSSQWNRGNEAGMTSIGGCT